jgi:hypothetical protein
LASGESGARSAVGLRASSSALSALTNERLNSRQLGIANDFFIVFFYDCSSLFQPGCEQQ